MVSADDMAMMIATCAALRTTPCQIMRNTPLSDGAGGFSDDLFDITPLGLLCRVAPDKRRGLEAVAEGRIESKDYFLIAFPPTIDQVPTSLVSSDRIVALGQTFEIIELGPRTSEIEHVCRCVRIR